MCKSRLKENTCQYVNAQSMGIQEHIQVILSMELRLLFILFNV